MSSKYRLEKEENHSPNKEIVIKIILCINMETSGYINEEYITFKSRNQQCKKEGVRESERERARGRWRREKERRWREKREKERGGEMEKERERERRERWRGHGEAEGARERAKAPIQGLVTALRRQSSLLTVLTRKLGDALIGNTHLRDASQSRPISARQIILLQKFLEYSKISGRVLGRNVHPNLKSKKNARCTLRENSATGKEPAATVGGSQVKMTGEEEGEKNEEVC
ncbi:UNVERIFIED_CONTAM: hypothetical protein PYX00_009657 [Menopon gallinae]|uniref:Uncharacterized protein n=1 Tax=Menopon gallinae TaxID=328185 RepID=A0AAW2HCG7_9NEOP